MDFLGTSTAPENVSSQNPDNNASCSSDERQQLGNHKKKKSNSRKADDQPPPVDYHDNDRIITKHEAKSKRRRSSKKALTDESSSSRLGLQTNMTHENSSYLNQSLFFDQSAATATGDFSRSDEFDSSAGNITGSEVSAASPETPTMLANDSVDADLEKLVKRKSKSQRTSVESSSRRKSKTTDVRIDASEALVKKPKALLMDGSDGAAEPKSSTRRKSKQKFADIGDAEPTYSASRRKSKAETQSETETPKRRKSKKTALDRNSDDIGEPSNDDDGELSKESLVVNSTDFAESAKDLDWIGYDELPIDPQTRPSLRKFCWTCAKHQDPNRNDYEIIPKETSIREAMRLCWECPDPDGDDFNEASPKGKRKTQKFGTLPKPRSLDIDDEYLDESLQPEIIESISGINSPEKQLIINNMMSDVMKASLANARAKSEAIAESAVDSKQDDNIIERETTGIGMHGVYDEGTACSHLQNDVSEMTSASGLTSMTSTLPGSSQKSFLPALESEHEPQKLYEVYTTALNDASTTGGTDTTSTLNTEGNHLFTTARTDTTSNLKTDENSLCGLSLHDSLERFHVAETPLSDIVRKHSIPWLNETVLQRRSSLERNAVKRSSTNDLGLENKQAPNRQSPMLGISVVPERKRLPDYSRDVSLPADIAILPRIGNPISSTTLTKDLESGSIEADPNSFLHNHSWGVIRFNSIRMLATNMEESYRSLGGNDAKKNRIRRDEISEADKGSQPTSWLCCFLAFALTIVLIIGVTVPVLKKRKGCGNCDVTVAPSSSPSLSLDGLASLLEQALADEATDFQGDKSPQSKAFDWIVAGSASHSLSSARIVQRYALATIYFSTRGDSWFVQTGWLSTEDECGWFSSDKTICNPDGELINLSLVYNSLGGNLPNELALLTKLQFLDLTGNNLSGSIPAALGGISSLVSLTLSDNYLTGSIPEGLQSLDKLETLILSQNDLQSTIPTQLGLLLSLKYVSLNGNAMNGSIPSEISQLAHLRSLRLDHNHFVGSVPPALGFLYNLEVMDLTDNEITGSIPSEFGWLQKLQFLSLGSNAYQGSLPDQLGSLYNLIQLDLSDNDLIGSVPSTFGNLAALKKLDISDNNLIGTVPLSLWLVKIMTLSLSGNGLTGVVPDFVCNVVQSTVGSVVRVSCDMLICNCCECIAVVDKATSLTISA